VLIRHRLDALCLFARQEAGHRRTGDWELAGTVSQKSVWLHSISPVNGFQRNLRIRGGGRYFARTNRLTLE
jgi:hypothetical protein